MDTASLMGFAVLGSMKKAERKRAETPLILTLVPGPPSTRAAISTVAVGNQARDSLRREKKVAAAVVTAVEAVVAGQSPDAALAAQAALRDLDPDSLAARLGSVRPPAPPAEEPEKPQETEIDRHTIELATSMIIEAIGRSKNQLFTEDEAKPFDDYLELLSDDTRAKIVKISEAKIDVVT